MTQPHRPAPRFQVNRTIVWTPDNWRGLVVGQEWGDGEWIYEVRRINHAYRYAEHELTEAGR